MKTFNYGDPVVVLCQRDGTGGYYDMPGVYHKLITAGTNRGKHEVAVNGVELSVATERLADANEYFEAYNGDKTRLPGGASGRLQFVEYVERDKVRGQLLKEILKKPMAKED